MLSPKRRRPVEIIVRILNLKNDDLIWWWQENLFQNIGTDLSLQ